MEPHKQRLVSGGWFYIWQPVLAEDGALAPKHVAALCMSHVNIRVYLVDVIN
jgi:hypothetical protein